MGNQRYLCASLAALLICILQCASHAQERQTKAVDLSSKAGCSSICLVNDGYAVFGANLDYNRHCRGQVYFNKRGIQKDSYFGGPSRGLLTWTSKYSSLSFNFVGYQLTWAGINEKGLALSTMALYNTTFDIDDERPLMDNCMWLQFLLDTCETIEEVIDTYEIVRPTNGDHHLISDRFGNSAVIEFPNGEMLVHTGQNLPIPVCTNTEYAESYSTWAEFRGSGRSYSQLDYSLNRFCTAADRVEAFTARSSSAAVDYAFETLDLLNNYPTVQAESQWSLVFDARNMRAYFRTATNQDIRYVDLCDFEPYCDSPVKMLDIQAPLSGNVIEEFVDIDYETSYDHLAWFIDFWNTGGSEDWVRRVMTRFFGYPCTEEESPEDFCVSRDIGGLNTDPRFAVEPEHGGVLVVWTQRDADDASYSRIWSALLRRTISGQYHSVEQRPLSDAARYNARPFPVYLPDRKCFLVVWDQADPAKPFSSGSIQGLLIGADGIPKGGVFTVLTDANRNEYPVLCAREITGTRPAQSGPAIKISLAVNSSVVGNRNLEKSGLSLFELNENLRATRSRLLLPGGVVSIGGEQVPQRVLPRGNPLSVGQNLFIPVAHKLIQFDGSIENQLKLVVVDGFDNVVDVRELGAPEASRPEIAALEDSGGNTVLLATFNEGGDAVNQAMSIPARAPYPLLIPMFTEVAYPQAEGSLIMPICPGDSPASARIACQLFVADNGRVYRRGLMEHGQPWGAQVALFDHNGELRAMAGGEILQRDGAGNPYIEMPAQFVVLWQRTCSDNHDEIRARIFSLER